MPLDWLLIFLTTMYWMPSGVVLDTEDIETHDNLDLHEAPIITVEPGHQQQ